MDLLELEGKETWVVVELFLLLDEVVVVVVVVQVEWVEELPAIVRVTPRLMFMTAQILW